jgi:Tol biopolymer transport system component
VALGAQSAAKGRGVIAALALLAVLALAAAVWGWSRRPPVPELPVQRFEFTTSAELPFAFPILSSVAALAISPSGDRVVYSARKGASWILAVRNLDQLNPRPLPGTEGGFYPEFSPDGRWIAFDAGGAIRKIAVDGSGLTTIAPSGPGGIGGLTWLSNDEIAFGYRAVSGTPGLWRVSASGGVPRTLSSPDTSAGERIQLAPRAVDGGRLVLYTSSRGTGLLLNLGVFDTRTGKATALPGLNAARALGLVNGRVVYVRGDGALMMVPLDTRRLTAGTPVQVGDSVAVRAWDAAAALSATGTLVYQKGGVASQLVRTDLAGNATVLVDSVRPYLHPRYSPDGTRIAFGVTGPVGIDIWIIDLGSGALERLTSDGGNDRPEWSADGRRVGYSSSRDTVQAFWWQPADGSAPGSRLQTDSFPIREGVLTRDGKALLYRTDHTINSRDIWLRPLTGDSSPVGLLVSINDEKEPRPSPDSRWLAYVSNESGREEVYVRSLTPGGGRVPVSAGGGGEPLWAPRGLTLYYRAGDQVVEAALAVTPSLRVVRRRVLFSGPYASDIFHPNWDVAPDGKSFLMVKPVDQSRGLVIVVNWAAELRRRTGNP